MNNAKKSIIAACATMGIDIEHGTVVSLEQVTELSKILKEEYGIDTVVVNKEREEIETAMNELTFEQKPSLEFCGTPPDGKARRRERRRLERLKRKKK
jgi:hypothetical protein